MPEYVAFCRECYNTFKYFSTIEKRNTLVKCFCGEMAKRNVEAEFAAVGDRKKWIVDNERWSLSMGVPVAQLGEFRKRFPNSTYDNSGRLLIKNRSDKLRQAKERNFVELDNRKD